MRTPDRQPCLVQLLDQDRSTRRLVRALLRETLRDAKCRAKEVSMNPSAASVVNDIKKYGETLQGLKDELQVRIHLAGMEVKDTWRELEPQLRDAETAAKGIATDATRTLLTETIQKLIALRSRLDAKGAGANRGS
jgi:hypothetical protein